MAVALAWPTTAAKVYLLNSGMLARTPAMQRGLALRGIAADDAPRPAIQNP